VCVRVHTCACVFVGSLLSIVKGCFCVNAKPIVCHCMGLLKSGIYVYMEGIGICCDQYMPCIQTLHTCMFFLKQVLLLDILLQL